MGARIEEDMKIDRYINSRLINMPRYVSEWNSNLKASKKTAATRKDFVNKICNFIKFMSIDNNFDISNINANDIENYLISLQTKVDRCGKYKYTSDSYQQGVWTALNNFFKFLNKRGYVSENIISYIEKPKNNDLDRINRDRKLLTKSDFLKILDAVSEGAGSSCARKHQEKLRERDSAIMILFMKTGMRESALVEINISDIDFDDQYLYVVDKGNKNHKYYLDDDTMKVINKWLLIRENMLGGTYSDALFISESKNRITQSGVAKMVKKYTNEALGISLSPHKIRSGFCSILYSETGDAEFVRRAVGHSNISTTQRYIATNNDEKKKAAEIMSFL